jgi:hypothetical protein
MSTRSLTIIKAEHEEIVVMYRQSDGYPEGHGQDLAKFLTGIRLTNGISLANKGRTANGMSCLAAQIVLHFKTDFGVGGIYLYKAGTRGCGENYHYEVTGKEGEEPTITCYDIHISYKGDKHTIRRKKLYSAPAHKFAVWAHSH